MPQPHPRPEWLETSGKKDGRYVVGPLLGRGGMGDVYEAWDTLLDRLVALKILTHVEPAAMVRFMHEAQLQARLEHPRICRIYDVDVAGGVPRIAMQLVRGPTLEEASPDLELTEVVTIIARVAETLREAHRNGLIHRDVKPGNIILEWKDAGGWDPVICDFGLALALNESSLTQPNALTGTPAYMAPEQVRGDRKLVGPATDVYGLGSTLYFLLLGRPPCVSTVTKEMLRVKRDQRFPRPRALEPSIPEELEEILLRCLAPDPGDRYPGMADLARDLWAFLDQEPAPPPAPRTFLRIGIAIAILVLAGLGFAALARFHEQARLHKFQAAFRAMQEAENMDQGLRRERGLPLHDIRPALAQIRREQEALPRAPGGEGDQALQAGMAEFCLGDFQAAHRDLARAWAGGAAFPLTAFLLGNVCAEEWMAQGQEAAYRGTPPPGALRQEAEAWFRRARGLSRDRETYARALAAYLEQDLPGALAAAGEAREANPWRTETAVLGALCHAAMARESRRQGRFSEARVQFLQSLEWAEDALRRAPSDATLHHAAFSARMGLAELDRNRGSLSAATLGGLTLQAQRALAVDPDSPIAQGDWLALQGLRAMDQLDRHLDPKGTLEEAMTFYWSRTRPPRIPALRSAHMILYGLMARREAARGASPARALAEALQDPGHIPDAPRDYLEDILEFQAAHAARGAPSPGGK